MLPRRFEISPASSLVVVCLLSACAGAPAAPAADPPSPTPEVEVPPASNDSEQAVPTEEAEADCEAGDAEACERLSARYLIGAGVDEDPSRARDYQKRALELRWADCSRGVESDCQHLPSCRLAVSLPPAAQEPRPNPPSLMVMLSANGKVFVEGQPISDLDAELPRRCKGGLRAFIQADENVPYAKVIELLDSLKRAGCTRIAFAVQPKP